MKTRRYTRNTLIAITMVALLAWTGFPVVAQDDDDDVEARPNWEVIIGGGGLVMPAYRGSDTLEVEPVP
jgi:hypothetical protein